MANQTDIQLRNIEKQLAKIATALEKLARSKSFYAEIHTGIEETEDD